MRVLFNRLAAAIFGTKHDREMKSLRPLLEQVNALEPQMRALQDKDFAQHTQSLRQELANGAPLDSLLCRAFALCREAAVRTLSMRHYDVQIIGGIVLHRGRIAEMKTGEGKTLVATLPLYLHGLRGKGAHLVTVNDYLAQRDSQWMGRVYSFLGLNTGAILHGMDDQERKRAYGADVTYCTNNELGFDYLRDNMKHRSEDLVQRGYHFGIVDECDSILIDESRTPLIISGSSQKSTHLYTQIDRVVGAFKKNVHFELDEKHKQVSLTDAGNHQAEQLLGVPNLFEPQSIELIHFIYQALRAHHLFQIDVDYMVKQGEVVIVDEFTGRLMPGRRWSDGLHQAIEAKEGLKVRSENQTLATISFQNYFRMYKKLSGMTGTADTEAMEFRKIYGLDVSVIPTNKPVIRNDKNDLVYKNQKAKLEAIALYVKERYEKGQPVLVGTISIEKSEELSQVLKAHAVPHNVLNAKHHEREAEIVAQAGRYKSVTIATNMAGRGTDIVLGGNSEMLAKKECGGKAEGAEYEAVLEKWRATCAKEREQVVSLGGLSIVGTERHESRRIDNQLRGRSGRQGDPGESVFFISLDDNLMRIFNGERVQKLMNLKLFNIPDDQPLEAGMVNRTIENSQRKVEGHNFDARKSVTEYDDVMNQQRQAIYSMRHEILESQSLDKMLLEMLGDVTSDCLDTYVPEGTKATEWDLESLSVALGRQFGLDLHWEGDGGRSLPVDTAELNQQVAHEVKRAFDSQKARIDQAVAESGANWAKGGGSDGGFGVLQKMVLLETIDSRWREHLENMERLREGVSLRGYAQKDPLIEYKKEGFNLFEHFQKSIRAEVVEKLLKIQISPSAAREVRTREAEALEEGRLEESAQGTMSRAERRRMAKAKKKRKQNAFGTP